MYIIDGPALAPSLQAKLHPSLAEVKPRMSSLYFGTDQFDSVEFQNRRVIDEINMSMTAFDCMLPDDAAIYCSSDITTGKRFYYEVLKKYEAHSADELKEKLGAEEFKRVQTELVQGNVMRGSDFAERLRARGLINVVTPGPFFAKGFTQQHYLYLWELFIIRKAYEVRFNVDWEYSNGCTLEYAIAARKEIPRFDHEGNAIELSEAINKTETAVAELREGGFLIRQLEQNLGLIKSLETVVRL